MAETAGVGSGSGPARTSRKWLAFILGLVIAVLLVYAVVVAGGGLRTALDQLRHASLGWLAPALLLEMSCYALCGLVLRMLRGENTSLHWVTTVRVALVVWGLGSLLPASPAEGIAMSVAELRRRGVDAQSSLTMLFLAAWFELWALIFTAALALALVGLVIDRDPVDGTRLVIGAAILITIALTVISLARRPATGGRVWLATWWLPRHRKMTRDELRAAGLDAHARISLLMGGPGRRGRIALAAVGYWITDAACLWTALHAVHLHVKFSVVILAYVGGTLASWVPLLPGGLGAVEAVVPAILHHFGVPLTVGLAGTLLWRGLSLFLPAIGGAFAYASLRAEHPVLDRSPLPEPPPL